MFDEMTDLDLRMWCAEQSHDANEELNLDRMKELYQFVSAHEEVTVVHKTTPRLI
mgnify:CR=1 FL=1